MEEGTKKTIFWAVWQLSKGKIHKRELVEETTCREIFYKWLSETEDKFEKEHGESALLNCGMI